eukprot:COSAG06_NODE_16424_length_1002_cov_1.101883_1_plen_323_part_10
MALRMAPVEVMHEHGSSINGYTIASELTCTVCSYAQPDIECPVIPEPDNGVKTCTNGVKYASQCTFACLPGYDLVGPSSVACMDTNDWSSDLSTLACVAPVATARDVYTRWGADSCPELETLIYVGAAMTAPAADSGSGANTLCVADGPMSRYSSPRTEEGGRVNPATYFTSNYEGLDSLARSDGFDIACAVCSREHGAGFTLWGGDGVAIACPARAHLSYSGYTMVSPQSGAQRATPLCVDRAQAAIVRKTCDPRHACPANGTPLTAFHFNDNLDDFVGNVGGYSAGGTRWRWNAGIGGQDGVLESVAESYETDVYTKCTLA